MPEVTVVRGSVLPTLLRFGLDPLRTMQRLHERHGRTLVFRQAQRLKGRTIAIAFTREPALVSKLLAASDDLHGPSIVKRGTRGSAQQMTRGNLFRMHGEAHRRHRRVIAPALGAAEVAEQHGRTAERVLRWLGELPRSGELDLVTLFAELTKTLSAEALFGPDDAAGMRELLDPWASRNMSLGSPFSRGRLEELAELGRKRILDLLERRAREPGRDMLTQFVRSVDARGGIGRDELAVHVPILYYAGHVSTTALLSWSTFLIAQHPEIAQQLRDEASALLHGDPPSPSQIEQLDLLRRVVDETMRILPVVPLLIRWAERDTVIGPLTMPARSRAHISIYSMHHDPELFPEPERFHPDRWPAASQQSSAYLPFGGGPHMCVGRWFGMQTVQTVLPLLLQHRTWRVGPGARIDRSVQVTLSPRRGIPVRMLDAGSRFERAPIRGNVREMVSGI